MKIPLLHLKKKKKKMAAAQVGPTWNLYLMHGAVRAADNGSKQLSLTMQEKLYREYAQKNSPNLFEHTTSTGAVVTVHVHEGKKCPFPAPA